MKLRLLFSLIFLISLVSTSYTQIDLGKIARDAKRTVNKRVDRNIDRAIDNTLDEAEDVVRGKNKNKKDKDDDFYYDENGEIVYVKEVIPNVFAGQFMITRDIENGEGQSNMYLIAMEQYETAIRPLMIKEPHNLIIYNKQDETKTTINNEKYEGKALKDWVIMDELNEKSYADAERTDEIETIDGYIARKYLVEHKDYEGEIWFTREIDADLRAIYHLLELEDLELDPSLGFPLKMVLEFDDDHKETFKVSDIKAEADSNIFDISNYSLVDMTDLESGK